MRSGDFIFVKNLLVRAVTGKDVWTRYSAQPLNIGVGIGLGNRLRRLGLTDDIHRTINYDSLSESIVQQVENEQFDSVENTAQSVLQTIKKQLSTGEIGHVEINRPKARTLARSHSIKLKTDSSNVTEAVFGLNLPAIIGINELERLKLQVVQVDIEVDRKPDVEILSEEFTNEIAKYLQSSCFLTVESLANSIAELVCSKQIDRVRVKVGKPSALNRAEAAQVQVERQPHEFAQPTLLNESKIENNTVYIAFGTNIGDTVQNIRSCVSELNSRGIKVLKSSAIYKSEPMYYSDQPEFLNGVFECTTSLSPVDLLAVLKSVEYGTYGRVKHFDNGPRTMDLDIILYNNETVDLEELKIPHIDMLNRSFVLRPLNDVLPHSTAQNPAFPEVNHLPETEAQIVPLYTSTQQQDGTAQAERAPSVLEFTPNDSTKIMAIVNATPDSFSDGGDLAQKNIVDVVSKHLRQGAHIIDVGGQSTRPGAPLVSAEEESRRVCEAISTIRTAFPEVIVSVDTFRGSVADDALKCGANIINDVFSGTLDPTILAVAAKSGAPIILSHSRGTPENMHTKASYPQGVIHEVATELRERVNEALAAGCQTWQLILDPGLGFAKTAEQDISIVQSFNELRHSPILTAGLPLLPWLVGPSRKSFIGHFSGEDQPKKRGPGTIAVLTAFRQQGASIARVHDTEAAHQALKIADKIYSS